MKKFLIAIPLIASVFFFSVPFVVSADTTKTTTTTKKTTAASKVCPPAVKVVLQEEARQINASYAFKQLADLTPEGFIITINNIPKSLYVRVTNKTNSNTLYVKYADTGNSNIAYNCNMQPIDSTERQKLQSLVNDGTYVFRECSMNKVITYTLSIRVDRVGLVELLRDRFYSSYYQDYYDNNYSEIYAKKLEELKGDIDAATDAAEKEVQNGVTKEIDRIASLCSVDDVRSIKLTTPKRNAWYDEIPLCKDDDLKNSYYCQEWVTFDYKISKSDVIKRLEDQKTAKYKTTTEAIDIKGGQLYDFFVKYGLVLVLAIALLVVLDIIFIVYNLWRRKEKGKL